MTLCVVPKNNFYATYRYIVIKTLEIMAKNFPTLAKISEKRIKEIEKRPEAFDEKISILLESLSCHYMRITASKDTLKVEGVTKKIFIPYNNSETKQKGVKDAGRYLITIDPRELNNEITKPSAEKIICMERMAGKNPSHPHINFTKKPCWGEKTGELIKKLVEEGRFLEALLCVPNFLSRINLSSAFSGAVADFFLLKEAGPESLYEEDNRENE